MHIEDLSDGTLVSHSHEHGMGEPCKKGCSTESHKSEHALARHVKEHFGGGAGEDADEAEEKGRSKGNIHELNDKFNALVKGSSKDSKIKEEKD